MLFKSLTLICCLIGSSLGFANKGYSLIFSFEKSNMSFAETEDEQEKTDQNFIKKAFIAGYHDFAKGLILDFKSKEATLIRINDQLCIGSFSHEWIHPGEVLSKLTITFKGRPKLNKGCHNKDFTLVTAHFSKESFGYFNLYSSNLL